MSQLPPMLLGTRAQQPEILSAAPGTGDCLGTNAWRCRGFRLSGRRSEMVCVWAVGPAWREGSSVGVAVGVSAGGALGSAVSVAVGDGAVELALAVSVGVAVGVSIGVRRGRRFHGCGWFRRPGWPWRREPVLASGLQSRWQA
ncbi:MAG: hypothetical protein KatS3mg059_0289 [Thermomicrobiales bacterium]|nr:MAG: hypothetical protein KatS3mg059_0289 [Thermomicrobiales bacterium]